MVRKISTRGEIRLFFIFFWHFERLSRMFKIRSAKPSSICLTCGRVSLRTGVFFFSRPGQVTRIHTHPSWRAPIWNTCEVDNSLTFQSGAAFFPSLLDTGHPSRDDARREREAGTQRRQRQTQKLGAGLTRSSSDSVKIHIFTDITDHQLRHFNPETLWWHKMAFKMAFFFRLCVWQRGKLNLSKRLKSNCLAAGGETNKCTKESKKIFLADCNSSKRLEKNSTEQKKLDKRTAGVAQAPVKYTPACKKKKKPLTAKHVTGNRCCAWCRSACCKAICGLDESLKIFVPRCRAPVPFRSPDVRLRLGAGWKVQGEVFKRG